MIGQDVKKYKIKNKGGRGEANQQIIKTADVKPTNVVTLQSKAHAHWANTQ